MTVVASRVAHQRMEQGRRLREPAPHWMLSHVIRLSHKWLSIQ